MRYSGNNRLASGCPPSDGTPRCETVATRTIKSATSQVEPAGCNPPDTTHYISTTLNPVIRSLICIGFLGLNISGTVNAQSIDSFSLTGIKPLVNPAREYIRDPRAAQALGKALFWDIAAGSDGQSCASCHFVGGADNRLENQVAPGHDNAFDADFNGNPTGPNAILTADHFPFQQQADILDRNSEITQDINDRFSSQGTFNLQFNANGELFDDCTAVYDPSKPFHERNLIYRIVEPRNTPTNINAGYYFRLALDGRARNLFTGPPNGVIKNAGGTVSLENVALINSTLARQSTAPPLDNNEMTCAQRTFIDIARKLLDKKPLQYQEVHPNDSRLRDLRDPSGTGLVGTYRDLIQAAFRQKYWNDSGARYNVSADGISVDADGVTQTEHNFLLFWGLSMQAYQAILVSDRAPVDRGLDRLKPAAQRGFELFTGKGNCSTCHTGPLFADSTTTTLEPANLVNNVEIGDGSVALMDRGFHNIGVTPTSEDLGLGGPASGVPFSHTVQWVDLTRNGTTPNDPEVALINSATFDEPLSANSNFRTAIDGAFKTTTLRNVGLTPPYFHDGSYATLKQVVQFYNRGGNTRGTIGDDTSGSARAPSNLSFNIKPLGLTNSEVNDLVAFLLSLTDYRVACHKGVFDHPSLPLTRGHQNAGSTEPAFGELAANDYWSVLPAVGRGGLKAIGKPCFPNTGRLFGKAQTVLNEITDFEPYYEVPADKPDSRIGFDPDTTPPTTPPEEEWLYCASTDPAAPGNGQCYFPEIKTLEARFVSDGHETAYREWGPLVWCLPHMFGVPYYTDGARTEGVCEYRPLEYR